MWADRSHKYYSATYMLPHASMVNGERKMNANGLKDELSYLEGEADGIRYVLNKETDLKETRSYYDLNAYCEGIKSAVTHLRNWLELQMDDDDQDD